MSGWLTSRRVVRILAWTLALLAAAGVGAFIAAHTNPLQPDVEASTPSATATATAPSPSPTGPSAERWSGTIVTRSEHELHFGGTCRTDWKTRVSFDIGAKGNLSGDGEARRTPKGDPCPFETAQPQIERFELLVDGWRDGKDGLVLAITETSHQPTDAATDLGGFSGTVLIEPLHLTLTRGHVRERVVQTTPDRKAGTYRAVSLVQLFCESC